MYAINYHTIVVLSAKSISTKKNTLFSSAILFTISILGSTIQKLRLKNPKTEIDAIN